jgi:hypothetical protein
MTLDQAPAFGASAELLPEYLRLNEAVRLFPFSRSDLYRRSQIGQLTILKLGARRLVRRTELEALLAALPRLHPCAPVDAA